MLVSLLGPDFFDFGCGLGKIRSCELSKYEKIELMPMTSDLQAVFQMKYGAPEFMGSEPRKRFNAEYFMPDDWYEALVERLITPGCSWIDVGGGRDVFPFNPRLARKLAARCRSLVAVDPSDTLDDNEFAHVRVKCRIEDYAGSGQSDVVTMRMVAEHIDNVQSTVAVLSRILRPGGLLVIYTINKWSPVSVVSWLTPFFLHHWIKRAIWGTNREDTFPVRYRMNTRKELVRVLQGGGFQELEFRYLADCMVFHRFQLLHSIELSLWSVLCRMNRRYLENCLLGLYRRDESCAV